MWSHTGYIVMMRRIAHKQLIPQNFYLMSIQSVSPLAQPNLNIDFALATSLGQAGSRSTTSGDQRDGGRLVRQDGPGTCHLTNLSQLDLSLKSSLVCSPSLTVTVINLRWQRPRATLQSLTIIHGIPCLTTSNGSSQLVPPGLRLQGELHRPSQTGWTHMQDEPFLGAEAWLQAQATWHEWRPAHRYGITWETTNNRC